MLTLYLALGLLQAVAADDTPVELAPPNRTIAVALETATKAAPGKDPDDVLDYTLDFSPIQLGSDTLDSTSVLVTDGTVVAFRHGVVAGTQKTTTWLRGGSEGEVAKVRVRVHTSSGRQVDQTISLRVASR